MAKLINLNVYDAKNIICVWNEDTPGEGFQCGIALEDALRGFIVPRHVVVGIFDDGTTKAAGICSLEDINYDRMFLYNEFCYCVDVYAAKGFVRLEMWNSKSDEKKAKDEVYSNLLKSGVEIEEAARKYLTSE